MTNLNRRSALILGGSLFAATAIIPRLAFAQSKTINYWHTFTSQSEQAGLDEVLKLFAAAHPDITITPENIPNPEFMAKITAAVVANSRPSVTQVASERLRSRSCAPTTLGRCWTALPRCCESSLRTQQRPGLTK